MAYHLTLPIEPFTHAIRISDDDILNTYVRNTMEEQIKDMVLSRDARAYGPGTRRLWRNWKARRSRAAGWK